MAFFQPEAETMSLDRLRSLQSERLRDLVTRCYRNVPFYRNLLDEAGVDPASIRDIRDIYRLPFTRKYHLRDHYPFGLFAVPMDQINRIHASSGTTGKPTVVGYTRRDLQAFAEVVARSLVAAGCRPGMKLQNAYGYGLFTGGLGLHYGAEKLGMAVIPVSGGMTDRQLMLLQDFGVDAISCTPSYALTLAEEVQKRGISREKLQLKYAILGAEPWTESMREAIESGLGVRATNIYGLSEIMGPGVSQEDVDEPGTGSYIWEDHFFPEIVDRDTGDPLPEGREGVLVFTTLTKEGMPLLRYWTNDITHLYYDPAGKRTHVKMGPILGRADDMLIIRGVNLFHTQVEDLLTGESHLSMHYQLVVSRENTLDEVLVRVEGEPDSFRQAPFGQPFWEEIRGELSRKIKDNIGINMQVEICQPGIIPRSEGGKLKRILDLRKLKHG